MSDVKRKDNGCYSYLICSNTKVGSRLHFLATGKALNTNRNENDSLSSREFIGIVLGYTTAQAAAQIVSQVGPCAICDGLCSNETGFPRVLYCPLSILVP
jgi:hypothetical protein